MTPSLSMDELREMLTAMRKNAAELHLYASVMLSTTPEKQKTLEKIRDLSAEILELIDKLGGDRER